MKTYLYDLVIVGGGPIASSTAYFLSLNKNKLKTALLKPEPLSKDPYHLSTYLYAGGSIRSYFENREIKKATSETMEFIRNLNKQKIDLSLIEDYYCFLNRGVMVPSLNISSSKLVNYFLTQAQNHKIDIYHKVFLEDIQEDKKNNEVILSTTIGKFKTCKALIAIGHSVNKIFPEAGFKFKKRQLFVLDLKLSKEQKSFPHLILNLNRGIVYIFVKVIDGEHRFVIGQEDIFEEDDKFQATDYFNKLKNMGLINVLPFLKKAKVVKVLWGFDLEDKTLKIFKKGKILAACCGSAIRSCVAIGRKLSKILLKI